MVRKERMPPRILVGGGVYGLALYIMWKDKLATITNALALAVVFALLIILPVLQRRVFPDWNQSRDS